MLNLIFNLYSITLNTTNDSIYLGNNHTVRSFVQPQVVRKMIHGQRKNLVGPQKVLS
jgi:hypothetical protein